MTNFRARCRFYSFVSNTIIDYLDELNFCRLWEQVGRHFLVGRQWYRGGRQKVINSNFRCRAHHLTKGEPLFKTVNSFSFVLNDEFTPVFLILIQRLSNDKANFLKVPVGIDSRGYGFVQDDTLAPSLYDNSYILYYCPAVLMTKTI